MTKSLFLIIILVPLFFYRLVSSYSYDSDFGRDIVDINKIAHGDITLLGPKLSFGGIHAGPYYYYLFTPAIFFFQNHPESMLYLNAAIFLVTFVLISRLFGFLPALYLGTLPLLIYAARGPGNAFSYISLLILVLLLFPRLLKSNKSIYWLLYGFTAGVIINFHLINIFIFAALFVVALIYFIFKRDIKSAINVLLAGVGIVISFAPLILFELTHNFVQIRNTFVDQSYKAFTDNSNLSNNPLVTSANPITNLFLLSKYFSKWSGLPYILLLIANIGLFIKTVKKTPSQIIIFWTSIFSFLILSLIARSQLAFHYFFPFIIISVISIILLLENFKYKNLIITIFIVVNFIFFPKRIYEASVRSISEYRSFTSSLINSELFKKLDPGSFNVYVARETTVAPLGWEYRYFLDASDIHSRIPTEFAGSNNLLIIQESTNKETIDTLRSWEIDQFGSKKLVDKLSLSNRIIYLFAKN